VSTTGLILADLFIKRYQKCAEYGDGPAESGKSTVKDPNCLSLALKEKKNEAHDPAGNPNYAPAEPSTHYRRGRSQSAATAT
jgi:hypothetical protein